GVIRQGRIPSGARGRGRTLLERYPGTQQLGDGVRGRVPGEHLVRGVSTLRGRVGSRGTVSWPRERIARLRGGGCDPSGDEGCAHGRGTDKEGAARRADGAGHTDHSPDEVGDGATTHRRPSTSRSVREAGSAGSAKKRPAG